MSVPPEHIISLMKIVYCMAKEDLPLNKFKQLTHLGRAIEAPHLISENHPITYKNNICGRELLYSISSSIEDNIWKELSLASAIGIIVDESTDIDMESHLIIYVRYFINGVIKIRFLSLLEIENKDAKSIYSVITKPFIANKVDHKIFSFTSDGASVMQGKISGVEFCIYAKSVLKKIYAFFSNSSKRIQTLSTYQETLNNPQLKILKIFDVRWLSLYEAVNNICFSIEPLLDTFLHTI
ncbi:6033_t:CDS:2, partial [Dentiscutata erythropus]